MLDQSDKERKLFLQTITDRMEFYHFEAARQRISLRLDQNYIAKHLQITSEEYARIERGASFPSFETAIKIADLLHMPPLKLIWIGPPIGTMEE